ncbi:unnamed protein product [Mytilus edulis]|uniref:Uncharacterized protein n=1 Tax=Mytilus edulis TaxID=6550 RepID=A0A8S3TKE3_MYTED|nr:unnamed protein product [Mytilus edulis]
MKASLTEDIWCTENLETIPIQDVEEKITSIIANEQSSLDKQIEANDYEKQKLKEEISKLKDNIGHVPHHVQELQKEILQHWSNVLNKFVLTKAAQVLYQHIQTENVIAIIGPTGTSKSTYAYHIAFRLKNEYNYSIVPARQPSDIVQYYEPEVNITDKAGVTPLMVACKGSHFDVVETLLVSNADATQCDNDKRSPLEYACNAGNVDTFNLLLEHGAVINLTNKSGITPLHAACMNNHIQVVNALIEKMADINSVDVHGETPLYKACFNGDIEIVKTLLKKDAKINISDTSGTPPVAIARKMDSVVLSSF